MSNLLQEKQIDWQYAIYNFSFHKIPTGKYITVWEGQSMITPYLEIEGAIDIQGSVIFL